MTVQELYKAIDGDYEAAKRVMMMDAMIARYLPMLADDTSYGRLMTAWENKDEKGIFEATHAMKGVCGNLGLTSLSKKASELTEEFRPGQPRTLSDSEVAAKVEALKAQYDRTIEAIRAFQKEG